MTIKYTIHDSTEETLCDWCGCPLYPGDSAVMSDDELHVYCNEAELRAYNLAELESPDYGYRAFEYIT